ncbi:MAG: hypothetical protein NC924_04495, partial [Candidatus Omnitrophica bacterium]|nr:hypothetical protein [Candidatus Omnitrophota bacterium]
MKEEMFSGEQVFMQIDQIVQIDPANTKVEVNCRNVKAILLYFEDKYGRELLKRFIGDTRMSIEYLENVNNWISYEYWCALLEGISRYARDDRAVIDAGTYTTKKECFGSLERLFSRLGTVSTAYRMIAQYTPRYAKHAQWVCEELASDRCVLILRFQPGFKENKYNCLFVQGVLASIPIVFHLPFATVKHNECAMLGHRECKFEMTWQQKTSLNWFFVGVGIGTFSLIFLR